MHALHFKEYLLYIVLWYLKAAQNENSYAEENPQSQTFEAMISESLGNCKHFRAEYNTCVKYLALLRVESPQ